MFLKKCCLLRTKLYRWWEVNCIKSIQQIFIEHLTWTGHHAGLGDKSLDSVNDVGKNLRSPLTFLPSNYPPLSFLPYGSLPMTHSIFKFFWVHCDWKVIVAIMTTTTTEIITNIEHVLCNIHFSDCINSFTPNSTQRSAPWILCNIKSHAEVHMDRSIRARLWTWSQFF